METDTHIREEQLALKPLLRKIHRNVNDLYHLVNSNELYYQFSYRISIVMEVLAYLTVIAVFALIMVLPPDIRFFFPVDKDLRFIVGLDYETYSSMILLIKVLGTAVCLPLLGFAFCLRRNRATKRVIYRAFGEVTRLKNEFERLWELLNSEEQ